MNEVKILNLKVEHLTGDSYRVTSGQRMTKDDLMVLRNLGCLGYGQEFHVRSVCDGTEKPAFSEPSPLGKDYISNPYFVYDCYNVCDSSD